MTHVDGTDDGVGYGVNGTGNFGVIAIGNQVGVNARSATGEAAVLGNAGPGYGVEGCRVARAAFASDCCGVAGGRSTCVVLEIPGYRRLAVDV